MGLRLIQNVEQRRRPRRTGAVAVEVAVTAPILFLFFFFFWEFARAEMIRHTAATAAYEGARQGIVKGGSADDAKQTAQAILNAVAIKDADVKVTPKTITSKTTAVKVSVKIPLKENAWITPLFMKNLEIDTSMTLNRN